MENLIIYGQSKKSYTFVVYKAGYTNFPGTSGIYIISEMIKDYRSEYHLLLKIEYTNNLSASLINHLSNALVLGESDRYICILETDSHNASEIIKDISSANTIMN